eukprot:CAMPEP_0183702716 /NCGR_PEP_ID=MMETSP0737-20130205/735_1 /TAXON_ID=385413 /ORGANISM="Thalassiosira miniscula, Strain CCMP1093" /LENGTH=324 /DNA_ID=CAMNT_0025929379 /DNA_START=316 /DNA_END=1290 /DNA_ORIENTATION=+
MLGDSAAMIVDALTYGFNLYAERKKNEDYEKDKGCVDESEADEIELTSFEFEDGNGNNDSLTEENERVRLERNLQRRRRLLHLELVPPIMSVSILMIVISFVLRNSIHTLILDAHRSEKEQTIPNLRIMMTFSCLNLVLDLVNVSCFARAKHLMGYNTEAEDDKESQKYDVIVYSDQVVGNSGVQNEIKTHKSIPGGEHGSDEEQNGGSSNNIPSLESVESEEEAEDKRVNLNMCSAYTHVFADTIRSLAVIIASFIAQMVDSITPEVADSTAAVIVSVVIYLSLLPLFRGLYRTFCELRSITREEQELGLLENEPNNFEGEMS